MGQAYDSNDRELECRPRSEVEPGPALALGGTYSAPGDARVSALMGVDSAASPKEVVSRFYQDVFLEHDLSRLDDYLRDDYIQHNPDCPQGKAGFREFFTTIFRAVPDFRYVLRRMVAEGDLVMVHSTTMGTHTGGEWLGQQPTGNRLCFDVVDIFRVEEGKIAEHWDVADTFTFFSQLGVAARRLEELPSAGSAGEDSPESARGSCSLKREE